MSYNASEQRLQEALEIYLKRWVSTFPSDEELDKTTYFSSGFEKKMEKLLRLQKKPYYVLFNTALKRAVAIFFVVVVSLSTMMSVEAIRTPVIEFFIEAYERFSTLVFQANAESVKIPSYIEKGYYPAYMLEGFSLHTEEKSLDQVIYEYTDAEEKKVIVFAQYVINDVNLSINTEGTEAEEVTIQGHNGIYYENLGMQDLWWSNGEYIFSITTNINDYQKLILVAESVSER